MRLVKGNLGILGITACARSMPSPGLKGAVECRCLGHEFVRLGGERDDVQVVLVVAGNLAEVDEAMVSADGEVVQDRRFAVELGGCGRMLKVGA